MGLHFMLFYTFTTCNFIIILFIIHSNDSFGEPAVKLRRSSSAMLDQLDQDILIVDNTADGAAKSEEVS